MEHYLQTNRQFLIALNRQIKKKCQVCISVLKKKYSNQGTVDYQHQIENKLRQIAASRESAAEDREY